MKLKAYFDTSCYLKKVLSYRQKFRNAADDLISKIVGLHNKRIEERRLYELAVKGVLARRDGEGRVLLRGLHKKKKIVRLFFH